MLLESRISIKLLINKKQIKHVDQILVPCNNYSFFFLNNETCIIRRNVKLQPFEIFSHTKKKKEKNLSCLTHKFEGSVIYKSYCI